MQRVRDIGDQPLYKVSQTYSEPALRKILIFSIAFSFAKMSKKINKLQVIYKLLKMQSSLKICRAKFIEELIDLFADKLEETTMKNLKRHDEYLI